MAKLSINKIHADQLVAQVKSGEIFTVQVVDLAAKKVTIASKDGKEKVIGKATLERWYKEVSEDEVQKWNESEENAENTESSNADKENADSENKDKPNDSEVHNEEASDTTRNDNSGEATESDDRSTETDSANDAGTVNESNESIDGDSESDKGDNEAEQVSSPITPSNAGKDKDKAKGKKPAETTPKNAALMKVRQTIIDTVLADSPSIQFKQTSTYDVLKEKYNFAEITRGSTRFNVSVISKCLTEDQINKVRINPASYGWSIDADFTVFDEDDIPMAVQLIRQSREYRSTHPITRKRKKKEEK